MKRVALICHFNEEHWYGIDLVADMLLAQFARCPANEIAATRIQPSFRRLMSRASPVRTQKLSERFDRLFNRAVLYPNYLPRLAGAYDLFHIVDHSYSQLVRGLDPDRTLITCHDLDAFRMVLNPRPGCKAFAATAMARHLLTQFQRARYVVCVSQTVRAEALRHGIVKEENSSVAHNGVHPSCSPNAHPLADQAAAELLPDTGSLPLLLHVGSTIRRKRIELLLRTFAAVKRHTPAKLVRVGGPLNAEQRELASGLGILGDIVQLPFLERDTLAAVYRRANLLLLTSDGEGFGLPLAEAMACGCPVLCSDLPVLREVGGSAAAYVDSPDASVWSEAVLALLQEQSGSAQTWASRVARCIHTASRFSWANTAQTLLGVYRAL